MTNITVCNDMIQLLTRNTVKDAEVAKRDEMAGTNINIIHGLTLERFRTIFQAIPPPEIDFHTSFQSVDDFFRSEVDDLLRKLKSLRIRVLRDSYMQSALIVSVVYRSLNVDLALQG